MLQYRNSQLKHGCTIINELKTAVLTCRTRAKGGQSTVTYMLYVSMIIILLSLTFALTLHVCYCVLQF